LESNPNLREVFKFLVKGDHEMMMRNDVFEEFVYNEDTYQLIFDEKWLCSVDRIPPVDEDGVDTLLCDLYANHTEGDKKNRAAHLRQLLASLKCVLST
jgi:hypothetical protein